MLLITLVELGNGFLYCLAGARSTAQKVIRFVTFGYGFLLLVLGVAFFGLETAAWNIYFDDSSASSQENVLDAINAKLKTGRQLLGAFDVLHWIGTIVLVAFASFVVHKCKNSNLLRHVSLPPLALLAS